MSETTTEAVAEGTEAAEPAVPSLVVYFGTAPHFQVLHGDDLKVSVNWERAGASISVGDEVVAEGVCTGICTDTNPTMVWVTPYPNVIVEREDPGTEE